MVRRPPRSTRTDTTLSPPDALPIWAQQTGLSGDECFQIADALILFGEAAFEGIEPGVLSMSGRGATKGRAGQKLRSDSHIKSPGLNRLLFGVGVRLGRCVPQRLLSSFFFAGSRLGATCQHANSLYCSTVGSKVD